MGRIFAASILLLLALSNQLLARDNLEDRQELLRLFKSRALASGNSKVLEAVATLEKEQAIETLLEDFVLKQRASWLSDLVGASGKAKRVVRKHLEKVCGNKPLHIESMTVEDVGNCFRVETTMTIDIYPAVWSSFVVKETFEVRNSVDSLLKSLFP